MTLPSPPFEAIEGVSNFRDVGGYGTDLEGVSVRRNWIYRSAQPGGVTTAGQERMRSLGITTVFDLRSAVELGHMKAETPVVEIEGTRRIAAPVLSDDVYGRETMASKLDGYFAGDMEAVRKSYADFLACGTSAFRAIFLHLRDRPDEACLIHCAAGKDRTGVAVALILSLAGVDDGVIAQEYDLSEKGMESMKPTIRRYLASRPDFDWNEDMVHKLTETKAETMLYALDLLRSQYGGPAAYLMRQCGFSEDDISRIKLNLIESSSS